MSADQLEGRERTVAVQAMRKLSRTELAGLRIGLEALVELETELVAVMPALRLAAEREAQARVTRGLPVHSGPAWRGMLAARRALQRVGLAREDTETAADQGRVRRGEK